MEYDTSCQRAWDELLRHLSRPTTDLGWEFLAVIADWKQVNFIVYCQLRQRSVFDEESPQAKKAWAEARKDGRAEAKAASLGLRKLEGRWENEEFSTTPVLVPRKFRVNLPFVCLFHRASVEWTATKDGAFSTEGGSGHYETLLVDLSSGGSPRRLEGWIPFDHAMYSHLVMIATRILAAQYSDLARFKMAEGYNNKQKVAVYERLNTVGVRVGTDSKASKRKRTKGTHNLPGIIIDVHTHAVGNSTDGVEHQQYTVLTEFGILLNTWKIDELVPIALNAFPQLVALMDNFTARELMQPSHPDFTPVDKSRYQRLSVKEAWDLHQRKKKPPTVAAGRKRQVAMRVASVAAETALVASKVDKNNAPSLLTLSTQPTPLSTRSAPSHIIRIVNANSATAGSPGRYRVEWSDPPGEMTWVSANVMEGIEEHRQVVMEWRALEEKRKNDKIDLSED